MSGSGEESLEHRLTYLETELRAMRQILKETEDKFERGEEKMNTLNVAVKVIEVRMHEVQKQTEKLVIAVENLDKKMNIFESSLSTIAQRVKGWGWKQFLAYAVSIASILGVFYEIMIHHGK
jgi:chromosome segregation ATPase